MPSPISSRMDLTVVDVLVVCTANVARSPLFAARLQLEADRRAGPGVVVASAGIEAPLGAPAAAEARVVCARWGRTLEDHRARSVLHYDLSALPLVVTMELAHRRDLARREPSLADRSFTLRELVAIVSRRLPVGAAEQLPDLLHGGGRQRVAAVASLADRHRPPRLSRRRVDVPDPIGAGQPVYDQLGDEFTVAAATIAPVLFGDVTS